MGKYDKLLKWINKQINQTMEAKSVDEVMGMSEVKERGYKTYIYAMNSVKDKIAMLEQSENGALGTNYDHIMVDEQTHLKGD